jgi:spore coat polysaccharide biosynthesis protein SpsF
MLTSGRIFAFIQVRMGSTRLPGKVLMEIRGKPLIWHLFNQLRFSKTIHKIVFVTSSEPSNDKLLKYCKKQNWHVFRGSEQNVLDRYYQAAKSYNCKDNDGILRITGDDILHDPIIVDNLNQIFLKNSNYVSHVSNNRVPSFPYGMDAEVFSFLALKKAWENAVSDYDKEHVTPFIRKNINDFPFVNYKWKNNLSKISLSVDTQADFNFNKKLIKNLYNQTSPPFHIEDVLKNVNKK